MLPQYTKVPRKNLLRSNNWKSRIFIVSIFCFLIANPLQLFAQVAGDYRSINPGFWETVGNWERFDGTTWIAAQATPTASDGVININTNISIHANLVIDQVNVKSGSQLDGISGTITIANGPGDDLVNNGIMLWVTAATLDVAAGAVISGAGFEVDGNIINNGTIDVLLTMWGNTPQTLSGTGTINLLSLAFNTNVTIIGTQNITSSLNLGSSKLVVTGTSRVIIASTAFLQGTGYVIGNLQINYPVGTIALTFRVGDNLGYRPVDVAVYNSLGNGGIVVSTNNPDHPDIANSPIIPTKSVNRYWKIANNGLGNTNIQTTFTWDPADVDGGTNLSNVVVAAYVDNIWNTPSVISKTATSLTVNTTSFSPAEYQVGETSCIPTNEYRSATTGDWNNASTWEMYNGCTWVAATVPPSASDSTITIREAHIVTVSNAVDPVNADQIVVEPGATLTVNANTLHLNNSAGDDLIVNGTLNIIGGRIEGPGNVKINSAGSLSVSYLSSAPTYIACVITNDGLINWGSITLVLVDGTIINNGTFGINTVAGVVSQNIYQGTITNNSTGIIEFNNSVLTGWGNVLLTNNGTINVHGAGDVVIDFNPTAINHSGSVNVDLNSSITLTSGVETQTFTASSSFSGAGLLHLNGKHTLNGAFSNLNTAISSNIVSFNQANVSFSKLALNSGTLSGTAIKTVTGSMTWGGGAVISGGDFTIANGVICNMTNQAGNDGTMINNGTINWDCNTDNVYGFGGTLINNNIINIVSSGSVLSVNVPHTNLFNNSSGIINYDGPVFLG
ncbi:MAG: hypothetical protein ABIO04_12190, partial [Ferruginibacter sp.]